MVSTSSLKVNGKTYTVPGPIEPESKLVDFLRKEADCGTGTKIGCGEGGEYTPRSPPQLDFQGCL